MSDHPIYDRLAHALDDDMRASMLDAQIKHATADLIAGLEEYLTR